MKRIHEITGHELESGSLNRVLRDVVQSYQAAEVGAVHVSCAEESEREQVESFQHWFADSLLPELKFWTKSPLRLANLGARYECGAIPLAEQHFSTPMTREAFKLLLVKINSHVFVREAKPGHVCFGSMESYSGESIGCGALDGLFHQAHGPAFDELREAFAFEGQPRLEHLANPNLVDPEVRALVAALVNARLQARLAVVDIQSNEPQTPTLFVVVPCVTLNRKQRDTEIVVGSYVVDRRDGKVRDQYVGLGDDPLQYCLDVRHGHVKVTEDGEVNARFARDHRDDFLTIWQQRRQAATVIQDPQFAAVRQRAVEALSNNDPTLNAEILKTLGFLLLDVSPVPTSILLFAHGVAGTHHLYRVHRLVRGTGDEIEARKVVHEVLQKIDQLPPDASRRLIESLLAHHQTAGAKPEIDPPRRPPPV